MEDLGEGMMKNKTLYNIYYKGEHTHMKSLLFRDRSSSAEYYIFSQMLPTGIIISPFFHTFNPSSLLDPSFVNMPIFSSTLK